MLDNHRILIIDDMISIHDDFKKILKQEISPGFDKLQQMDTALSGKVKKPEPDIFQLDFALQGSEAIEKVIKALEKNHPYALAFVDVQMPPGIDGVETIEKIWKIDPEIQIVICTAYALYTWSDIQKRLGNTDRLFVLKKPFETIEIINLATTLTNRWNINRKINLQLLEGPTFKKGESEQKLEEALKIMKEKVENLKQINQKKFRGI